MDSEPQEGIHVARAPRPCLVGTKKTHGRGAHATLAVLVFSLIFQFGCSRPSHVTVGSKVFTESVLLGEIATQLGRASNVTITYRRQLGGTRILWDALLKGDVDIYPEYTGTLTNEIFAGKGLQSEAAIRHALAERGIEMTHSLGFNDTYALGMREETAQRLNIKAISDLRAHPELRLGFSSEFLDRGDGYPSLRDAYRLNLPHVTGLDHDLAYRALVSGPIDVTDLYSTDAEIAENHLRVLQDDLHHFPDYQAIFLYRSDLRHRAPQMVAALAQLQGRINESAMIAMNADAKIRKVPESQVASSFLSRELGIFSTSDSQGFWSRLISRTWEHLQLVSVSLLAAILIAIPLGIIAASYPRLGQIILGGVAAIYTIPSLALLVFMIPILGIGWEPAVVALFLYSLLPIARNTYIGLHGIPSPVRESAVALGLPRFARLVLVELPLASPAILAGIQTSAVLNVGTATLGALIGAGGYGQPILTGIRLDSHPMILEGAIPAAVLALLVQGGFELAGRVAVPKGLRVSGRENSN
jgi:osmoprotectant transport system permease protein